MTNTVAPVMGQWANAPLVFVLAQVRFLPQAGVTPETLRDAITNRLGGRFGTINQTNGVDIQIDLDGESNSAKTIISAIGYDMLNEEVNAMVRVVNGALTYVTTNYQNSQVFQTQWMDVLQALQDVGITNINRLGLRYVDFVIPSEGKVPEDYVVPPWDFRGMQQLPGATGLPEMSVSMMDVPYPEGRMRIQYMRGFGVPNLPADLQGMLPPATTVNSTRVGLCGIIDTDRWLDGNHPTDVTTLSERFSGMHTALSSAFKAIITPLAKQEWHPPATKGDAA